jgi:hypothetical protein
MTKALQLGVFFTKAAGNYGGGGPFEADANIAAGSIVVGSIDNPTSSGPVRVSAFSAYGPVGASCYNNIFQIIAVSYGQQLGVSA